MEFWEIAEDPWFRGDSAMGESASSEVAAASSTSTTASSTNQE